MSTQADYDADELRALAVALDVIDPEDPDEWAGDANAFATSVHRGRTSLEQRGVATFAHDGGAEVDPADALTLRAFLAPDAVIEAWVVDGSVASRCEWYLGSEVTVVADPAAGDAAQQELATIDPRAVFTDIMGFLDVRGTDISGQPVRLKADALDEFCGRPTGPADRAAAAPRLMHVAAAWKRNAQSRELQLLDAEAGGLWLVTTLGKSAEPGEEAQNPVSESVTLTPTSWAEIVNRILAVVTPATES